MNVVITTDGRRAYLRNNRLFTAVVKQAVGAQLDDREMTTVISLLGRLCGGPRRRG